MDSRKVIKALDAKKAVKTKTISFRIPPKRAEALEKFCEEKGYNVSELINELINSFLVDLGGRK